MLYFERIGISEGTYVNKTSASKGCSFCYYWYFLDKGLKFQVYVCNGYHDLLMMTKFINDDLSDIAICGDDYCCNINEISKSDAVNLLHNGERSINSIDINKIVVSSKDPFGDKGLKYFICRKNDKKS